MFSLFVCIFRFINCCMQPCVTPAQTQTALPVAQRICPTRTAEEDQAKMEITTIRPQATPRYLRPTVSNPDRNITKGGLSPMRF